MKRIWTTLLLALLLPAAEAADAPFLWTVQGPHEGARHFLLGSMHLLPKSAHPLPAALESAYKSAQGIVLESDLAALSSPELQSQLLAAARGTELQKQLPAPLYAQLQQRAATLGMPMELCGTFKPWFCALTLEVFSFQHAGFRADLGIDQHFFALAGKDNKPVRWLESPEAHLALFMEMPEPLSEQFLAETLEEQNEPGQRPEDMLALWRDADVAALEKASQEMRQRHPKAYERLLAGRNHAWLPRLLLICDEAAPQLIIVGAAHLVGPDGVVQLLRDQGYRVEPVGSPAAASEKSS
jgi:uncharacterized protein YbaP (TraB family)